jgi:hypothetical protein
MRSTLVYVKQQLKCCGCDPSFSPETSTLFRRSAHAAPASRTRVIAGPPLKEIGPNMSSRTDRLTVAAVGGVIGGAAALALAAHYQTL